MPTAGARPLRSRDIEGGRPWASGDESVTRCDCPVAVCGEMAGDLQLTRLLLGLGLRNFSMHPSQVLAIKERILRTNLAEVQALAQRVLRAGDPAKTRDLLARLNSPD